MIYPVVIHKDKGSDYGVTVPGLPGCFSAGRTLDEAMAMAKEAIELHLEGLIEEGQVVPRSVPMETLQKSAQYEGGIWALIPIDAAALRVHARRVNVTIPERILDAIDRAAAEEHDTRSGLLTKAATVYIQKRRAPVSANKRLRPASSKGLKFKA